MAILVQFNKSDVRTSYRIVNSELYQKILKEHRSKIESIDDKDLQN